jgi:hypothetical protein
MKIEKLKGFSEMTGGNNGTGKASKMTMLLMHRVLVLSFTCIG